MAGTDKGHRDGPSAEKHVSVYLTVLVVLCWYLANIALVLLNKFLLSSTKFRQPVFLSLCHMGACVVMGLAISASGYMPLKPLKSKQQFVKIFVLSVMFCASIVLGNASLEYIPVSFNQAIGATTPFFTAVFAFILQGTRESALTYSTLVPIVGGIAIASGGEPLFQILGFTFCLMATAGRALKSVAQSMILTDPAEKLDAMSLLMYMSAICVALLVPLTCMLEPTAITKASELMATSPHFIWWLLGNSMLAYFVNLTNFLVTKFTSPLTLQVLGNAKGVIAAVVSIYIFLNPVTVSGVLGYALTLTGVFLYTEAKRRTKNSSSLAQSHKVDLESKSSGVSSMIADATVVVSISTAPGHRDRDTVQRDTNTPRSTPRKDTMNSDTAKSGSNYFKDTFLRHHDRMDAGVVSAV